MLDETIELLTKQMLEDIFEDKNNNKETMITIKKVDLYNNVIEAYCFVV